MDPFSGTVEAHMHAAVYTVPVSASLEDAAREMSLRGVTGLVVVDDKGGPLGVISLTDLMLLTGPHLASGRAKLSPHSAVRSLFTADPVCVESAASLREAAELMIRRQVHRLLVVRGVEAVGVLSVTDLLRPVSESGIATPIDRMASGDIMQVAAQETVSAASRLLETVGVRALVVMEDGWPIGSFGQREAVAARDAGNQETVERWMSQAVLCIPRRTPLHRAAAQALAMGSPLIVTLDGDRPHGVLTPTDLLDTIDEAYFNFPDVGP